MIARRHVVAPVRSSSRRWLLPGALLTGALALGLVLTPTLAGAAPSATPSIAASRPSSSGGSGSSSASSSTRDLGRTLFDENCSSCHGLDAQGSSLAPNLRGLGSGTVDLWVSAGWMPLANPTSQPETKPSLFDRAETTAIAGYVASLAPGGFSIPTVNLKGASVSAGFSVFALNCAPCHTITGAGDALSNGLSAPPLHGVTAVRVAEAVRTGPGNMPRFGQGTISQSELTSVIAYVTDYIDHPRNPGGLGLGGVGPVAEGFIGLFLGVGLCLVVAMWIGDRTEKDEAEPDHGAPHGGDGDGAAGVAHA